MSDEQIKSQFLRLPETLHADLVKMAQEDDRTLHNLIIVLLKAAVIVWKARQQIAA